VAPIRHRLALLSGALVAVVILGLGAFVYLQLQVDLIEAVDDGLRSRVRSVLSGPIDEAALGGGGPAADAFGQLLTPDGTVLVTSPNLEAGETLLAPDEATSLSERRFFDAQVRHVDEPIPARLVAVRSDRGILVLGTAVEDQREALDGLRLLFGLVTPVAALMAAGIGWLIAGAALRPVERMRLAAEAVSGSEPGRRLPLPRTGDELARLGGSLNRMLERLEVAAERERRFVDDASHELRTPLANLKAELDLALRRARTPDQLVAALRSAADETDRLTRLAEDLLVLARSDRGGLPVRPEEVTVEPMLRAVMASFAARAAANGVALETQADADLRARFDRMRVGQAVANVLDNALRHTPRGGRVAVRGRRIEGGVEIAVGDTGEGFAPAFLPTAFEPFSRADAGRGRSAGGTGLGLAIVRAVAQAHGGTAVAANEPDGGASVTIRLPDSPAS